MRYCESIDDSSSAGVENYVECGALASCEKRPITDKSQLVMRTFSHLTYCPSYLRYPLI